MAAAAGEASGTDDPPPACDDSACSTPFVSAPSSPTRDRDRDAYPSHFFFSAPTSPTRGGGGGGKDGIPGVLDFDFDFSSRFPSPSAAAMSSADELFHNGQIRPVRLAAALLQPHPDPAAVLLGFPGTAVDAQGADLAHEAEADDDRGRVRSRSLRRKARSMSPFRTHWRSASHVPAAPPPVPEPESADEAPQPAAASRSSSSSSTASSASSASSSSSRGSRRWGGFLKDLLHRSKSDGGKTSHSHGQHSHGHPAAPSPSPAPAAAAAAAKGRGATTPGRRGRRRSAHERLYEARRAEAEEMRRRTSLPYRQGLLLFGCIGLGNRSYGAVHGLARGLNAAAAVSSRS